QLVEDEHDDRDREGESAEQTAEAEVVEGTRDVARGCEPLDDRGDDREQEEQERHAVTTLVLLEVFLAEEPRRTAHDVGETHPGGRQQSRLLLRDRKLLGALRPAR